MFRSCKIEIWKAFHSRRFYITVMLGMVFCIVNVITNVGMANRLIFNNYTKMLPNGKEWLMMNIHDTSVYYNWLGCSDYYRSTLFYFFLFPLLAAFPYGWADVVERKNGYRNQLLVRMKKKEQILGKYVGSFVAGGTVVTLPVILNFFMITTFLPMTTPLVTDSSAVMTETQFGSRIFYNAPILFLIANTVLIFVWGGALSVLALAIGQLIRNKIVAVFAPFCFCFLVELGYELMMWETSLEWSPIRLFHLVSIRGTSGVIILGEIFGILIVSYIIVRIRGMRDEGL